MLAQQPSHARRAGPGRNLTRHAKQTNMYQHCSSNTILTIPLAGMLFVPTPFMVYADASPTAALLSWGHPGGCAGQISNFIGPCATKLLKRNGVDLTKALPSVGMATAVRQRVLLLG